MTSEGGGSTLSKPTEALQIYGHIGTLMPQNLGLNVYGTIEKTKAFLNIKACVHWLNINPVKSSKAK